MAQEAQKRQISITALLSSSKRSNCVGMQDFLDFQSEILSVSDDTFSSEVGEVEKLLQDRFKSRKPEAIMVCGSKRLINLAAKLGGLWEISVQASLEAHMACGLGYCHGCSLASPIIADEESPLVCVDGPVFEVQWKSAGEVLSNNELMDV